MRFHTIVLVLCCVVMFILFITRPTKKVIIRVNPEGSFFYRSPSFPPTPLIDQPTSKI